MGVPAFFRWLSRKYPSVIVECLEDRVSWVGREGKSLASIFHILFSASRG